MIRVRIDTGQPFAKAMVARLLSGDDTVEIVASSESAESSGTPEGQSSGPDVVIAVLDPESDWESVLDHSGAAEVLLLVDDPSVQDWEEAMRSGVHGVLPSDVDHDTLVAALTALSMGLTVFPSGIVDQAFQMRKAGSPADGVTESLTSREKEVLVLLAEGLPNKVIAERLGISDHTVKFHVASILGKLGASSRTEAVTLAIRLGIIMI